MRQQASPHHRRTGHSASKGSHWCEHPRCHAVATTGRLDSTTARQTWPTSPPTRPSPRRPWIRFPTASQRTSQTRNQTDFAKTQHQTWKRSRNLSLGSGTHLSMATPNAKTTDKIRPTRRHPRSLHVTRQCHDLL